MLDESQLKLENYVVAELTYCAADHPAIHCTAIHNALFMQITQLL